MTNYEQATQIAYRGGYKIEDALELLNSGMSQEEVEKVLERKKKKLEKRESRRLDKEFGELIWNQIASPWIARRDKRRKWRNQCVDRWGSLADEIKARAFSTHLIWYALLPMLFLLLLFDLGKVPIMYGLLGFASVSVMRTPFCFNDPDKQIQSLWMTRGMFRWWTNRTGKRLFVRHVGEVIDRDRLVSIVGEKKATKLISKREAVQAKCAEEKRKSEEAKARQVQMARQYCSSDAEAEELYKEAAYHEGAWMLVVFFALCFAAFPISVVLYPGAPVAIDTLLNLLWFAISAAITYGIACLVALIFWDYDRSLKRLVRKRAISRVMGDEKESSKAEQENCSG